MPGIAGVLEVTGPRGSSAGGGGAQLPGGPRHGFTFALQDADLRGRHGDGRQMGFGLPGTAGHRTVLGGVPQIPGSPASPYIQPCVLGDAHGKVPAAHQPLPGLIW